MTFQSRPAPQPARIDMPVGTSPVHDARELTDGGTTAQIVLDGKVYLLRITRAGKLILTK